VLIGDQSFTVVGILDAVPLYESLDAAAFVGYPIADELFDTTRAPTSIYVVADPDAVAAVSDILPATTNPQSPAEVEVTNPSDALAAKEAVDETLTNLLLGLGGVALLVGGIGIANVMVIGVLERRTEIGVRRALGATKGHIRLQFLLEATLLGILGGIAGIALGVAVTTGYTALQDQTLAIPPSGIAGGLAAAVAIGAIAGLSPAARAARLAPAESIRPA
jgi:putative ABC transport system permease protein